MLLPSATKRRLSQIALVAALFCVSLLASPLPATGQSVEEIKKAREDLLRDSADLDKEIEVQRQKLLETSGQAKTLDGAVRTLDASVKKIDTSIKKTEVGIKTHELTILTLAESIAKNRAQAARDRAAVTRLLGSMDATQAESGLERILVADELGAVWESLDAASSVRDQLRATAATLEAVTEQLSAEELAERVEKERLSQARKALSGERESAATAKAEKAELLAETRNQEAEYQRILNEKLAQKEKFEAALREFEEQLQIAIDPDGYPKPRRGILAWPLREPIRITQLFGGTAFAKQHASAYGRPFHPGVDIGAPTGEPIKAALGGTIAAIGNTDAVRGCVSWGKWVLVKHANGLSTLYAHMSGFAVGEGDTVSIGQTIGYVGATGYATGPHLHITVYVTQGVSVRRFEEFKTQTGCSGATTPVAPHEAYLDPMDYLPSL
ncbi:MAG TPA: peptidoglycan DD-metalloendopeptidase family protein [Candidatus Paceibacterota bacterium]